jgi:hypothetical protein
MKKTFLAFLSLLLFECAPSVLYYGWLPGSDYQYYKPQTAKDLKGKKYCLMVTDSRQGIGKIQCSEIEIDRNSELEGNTGYDYFRNYCRAMLEFNNAIVDSVSNDTIRVLLKGLSAAMFGFGYIKVHGLVEFEVIHNGVRKNYCSDMVDGDPDSPLGEMSWDTRQGAFRKMVSGSTRRALEQFVAEMQP